jgi:RNA polymerase sigma-70 factor (ECF subfamily)
MNARSELEQIYMAEREGIYVYLLHLGVPEGRAQELAQDCFVKLYPRLGGAEAPENPRAWLYRVAHNLAMRFHGREPGFETLEGRPEPPQRAPDAEQMLLERERRERLSSAVGRLSPQQKHCLFLRVQGLRYREIAETLEISTSAAGEFLRRAVSRLKEALDG